MTALASPMTGTARESGPAARPQGAHFLTIAGVEPPEGGQILWHTARDRAPLRIALWADETARASILVLPGRTEFIEKYLEVVGELRARGLAVAVVDWRGQGLSARALDNPLKGHIDTFRTYVDDFKDIVSDILRPRMPTPLLLLCHSMGGNIGARILVDDPLLAAGAVFSAPMMGVNTGAVPGWAARAIANLADPLGLHERYVPGPKDRTILDETFAENTVTSDSRRHARCRDLVMAHKALALGPPTLGWLRAAFASMDHLARRGVAEAIEVPALFCVAGQELIVENPLIHAFARRMRKSVVVEFAQSSHEILMERDEIRREFWAAFDTFLDDVLSARMS